MVTTTGPAVGAKAQIGFAEESKWGYPKSPPASFVEFTSEGVVSEFTNLISASLRADRAVHKQRIGTEAAGGDINFELCPAGFGTLLKHALGKKRTKRVDIAFLMVYTGSGIPSVTLSANSLTSVDADTNLNITINNSDTVQVVLDAVEAIAGWEAYAAWGDGSTGYFAVTSKITAVTTLGSGDYANGKLAKTAGGVINLETFTSVPCGADGGTTHEVFFPINMKYGIYEHTIKSYQDLPEVPEGLTLEIGRDVAAFNYYGSKVNSLALNATPGEIVTGTLNVMSKGASTCGDVSADSGNTGWQDPIVGLKYAGSETSCKIAVDSTNETFYMEDGGSGTEVAKWHFSLERGYYDHEGSYYNVQTLGGFIEFLQACNSSGDFNLVKKPSVGYPSNSTDIAGYGSAASPNTLSADTETELNFDSTLNADAVPLIRGDYTSDDTGDSGTIYVKVSTNGAVDGTAAFTGSTNDSSYGSATSITYGVWYDILDGSDVDTGFDVMFPNNESLTLDDKWSFTTFKDANESVSYATEETFVGAHGSATIDDDDAVIMGLSSTITNNLFGDKYELGDRQRAALKEQQMAVEGTVTLEFDNLDLYRKFINGTAMDLDFTFTSDEYINDSTTKYSAIVTYANAKFSGTTPVAGGPEIITTDFPFVGLYDDTLGCSMQVVLTNNESYI